MSPTYQLKAHPIDTIIVSSSLDTALSLALLVEFVHLMPNQSRGQTSMGQEGREFGRVLCANHAVTRMLVFIHSVCLEYVAVESIQGRLLTTLPGKCRSRVLFDVNVLVQRFQVLETVLGMLKIPNGLGKGRQLLRNVQWSSDGMVHLFDSLAEMSIHLVGTLACEIQVVWVHHHGVVVVLDIALHGL